MLVSDRRHRFILKIYFEKYKTPEILYIGQVLLSWYIDVKYLEMPFLGNLADIAQEEGVSVVMLVLA